MSLIFFLYLGEYYLSFVVHERGAFNKENLSRKIKLYKKETGNEYDTRSKVEVYEQSLKNNNNTTVIIQPVHKSDENFFYLSGISKSETINCNENGYYSTFLSDRYGFNNLDEVWDSKNFEFVIVGDSMVLGSCVNRPNDFSSVLKKLSKKSVLNLGYVGNGPLSEYATLVEYLPKKVKNIIWFYTEENDLFDLISELNNNNLKKYLSEINFSFDLNSKQKKIDNFHRENINKSLLAIKNNDEYWDRYYVNKKIVLRFLRLNNFKYFIKSFLNKNNFNNNDLVFKNFKEVLSLTKKLAIKNESNLYFVYLGSFYRYKSFLYANQHQENYKKIIYILENLNIPIIDINKEFFLKQEKPLQYYPFGNHGHYNEEGYKRISELIYSKINN